MPHTSSRILFPTPGQARLDGFPRPAITKPTDVLIETESSIVSAGTKLAGQAVYEGLTHQKDIYTGVVFDWSRI
ncbi:MAG TPA: hypothetical protein VIO38_13815 [Rariglobus sp.]